MDKNELLRNIPKVDVLLQLPSVMELVRLYGRSAVVQAIRTETGRIRSLIGECEDPGEQFFHTEIEALPERMEAELARLFSPGMKCVINGTGTILHTNLGRAPLSPGQASRLAELVSGYSSLEYDLENGTRGGRTTHIEELLCRLTGAEAALVVNNNAAAVMLSLSTLARGGEVIVSRGELVEIGGRFRIPDVLAASGAVLRETGTTNKTRIEDYRDAVSDRTMAFLKVHTSNFRIIGFTESVSAGELSSLSEETGIPLVEDLGSGVLMDPERFGLSGEPTVREAVRAGADVICFSADKLLGGPQAGIAVGKKTYIDRMKKNPLMRALRIDKLTAAALELVLPEYLREETAAERIPVLRMISEPPEAVRERAMRFKNAVESVAGTAQADAEPAAAGSGMKIDIRETLACIGGGALPTERIPSFAAVISADGMSAARLEKLLRNLPVPVIGRIQDDAVWLDARTMTDAEADLAGKLIGEALG